MGIDLKFMTIFQEIHFKGSDIFLTFFKNQLKKHHLFPIII